MTNLSRHSLSVSAVASKYHDCEGRPVSLKQEDGNLVLVEVGPIYSTLKIDPRQGMDISGNSTRDHFYLVHGMPLLTGNQQMTMPLKQVAELGFYGTIVVTDDVMVYRTDIFEMQQHFSKRQIRWFSESSAPLATTAGPFVTEYEPVPTVSSILGLESVIEFGNGTYVFGDRTPSETNQ